MPMHPKRLQNPTARRPKVKDRDMNELVASAWACGAWCERGGTNHVKVYPPDGSRMVMIPSTPSDHRTVRNKRAALRRGGLSV